MPVWPKAKLADSVELLSGFAFKSQHFTDKPADIALVKGENVSQGRILWDISKRWPASDWEKMEKFRLKSGDVVVAMDRPWIPAGLKWAFIRQDDPKALLVQRCARLRASNGKLDQGFLRFVIGGPGFENYVKPITTGVNVPHISGKQILDFEFPLPPLPVQRRIAGILSAYDELMENNRRRIRLLEAIARALYREWFVLFRFPGHQSAEFIETQFGRVPEGWALPFADHVDFKEGPGLRNWQYRDEGLPFLNIRTLVDNDIDLSKVQFLDPKEVEKKYQHFLLREHDHVVSSSGTIGRIVTIRAEHLPLMLNTSIIRMRPQGQRMGCWLLKHFMLSDYFQNQAKSFAIGAAQANFGPIHLKQMQIIVPDQHIATEYERLVAPLELAILNLAGRIQNLRRTRDLLLPRLLSGQVNLEEN